MKSLQTILIISPEQWGINLLSKHHYAKFLAQHHQTFFLNPACGFSKIPFGNMEITLTRIEENLIQITYKNLLPKLNQWPKFIRDFIYRKQAQRVLNKINLDLDIVWSFDPRRYTKQQVWKAKKSIYHSVDIHPDSDEKTIAQNSDYVFALSTIIQKHLSEFRKDIHIIGHGCHVNHNNIKPEVLPGKNKIKATYVGNFHRHIDYKLLADLAIQNTDVDFILIGPTTPNNLSASSIDKTDLNLLTQLPNVLFLGSISGDLLSNYLVNTDVCLVVFKKEYETVHHSPHKLMAYFASGKIVVANFIDEYKNADTRLIQIVDQSELLDHFKKIKNNLDTLNSDDNILFRKNYALENSYEKKIAEIFDIIY